MYRKLHRRLSPSTFRKRRTIVALILGFTAVPAVALAATDAVPGDPFKLGQDNPIAGTTTLHKTGGASGPALTIQNSAPGISQHGLKITTRPNISPLIVNSDAGKAANLNADELDGKDSKDFLPNRLYTNTTGVINGTGNGQNEVLFVTCDNGDIALNGGVTAPGEEDVVNDIMPSFGSITIEVRDNFPKSIFRGNIICMDSATPHRPVG